MRTELAAAEKELRKRAEREAIRLAHLEHEEWLNAQERCLQLEQIRRDVMERLNAMRKGGSERFCGEADLVRMALDDLKTWELRDSAAYTIVSFANCRDRLRFLRGGAERDAVLVETIKCGGVYTGAYGGRHFQEIVQ